MKPLFKQSFMGSLLVYYTETAYKTIEGKKEPCEVVFYYEVFSVTLFGIDIKTDRDNAYSDLKTMMEEVTDEVQFLINKHLG